ncbi:MAG TPA: hypothetical protein VFM58_10945, partial [Solirubrobacteraceae bacterium]|nr:hypothetical protein [Solirubrobacteraceae bacterium]
MRLTFDLRTLHGARGDDESERRVTIEDLALMARRPRAIADLLWGRRYESTDVLVGRLPLNGVLAGAMGLAGLARTERLRVDDGGGPATVGRARYLARAS